MSKRFKLYATIKENAGFQCPESWCGSDKKYNHALYLLRGKEVKTDKNLIAWKHLLGID